jgi:hypothetical protein
LVFVRLKNKGYKFKLASIVDGLGLFDDVFVEYIDDNSRKKHIFIQLKSKLSHTISEAYPGILFGGVQQIQLRTEDR